MNEAHAKRLLSSYKRWTGEELLPINERLPLLKQLNEAYIVILSHGTEADPILNYGNNRAMEMWEMSREQFLSTPSRLTAEPMAREERAAFLEAVTSKGYINDYTGIRISATGRRFYIENATVWNVVDEQGQYCGQAASFRSIRQVD